MKLEQHAEMHLRALPSLRVHYELAMRLEQHVEMHPVSAVIEADIRDIIGKLPAAGIAGTTGAAGITRSAPGSVISGKVSHRLQLTVSLSAY